MILKELYFRLRYNKDGFVEEMNTAMAGTDPPNIGNVALGKILIALPKDMNEQKAIAQVLTNIDSDLSTLEKKLEKTKSIKQGMMQELLTGRTRLV